MHPFPPIPFTFTDEERLGALAMQFRGLGAIQSVKISPESMPGQ